MTTTETITGAALRRAEEVVITPDTLGVWVAMYSDRSSVVPFASELDALRHAVGNCMSVVFVQFGTDAFDVNDD